MNTRNSRETEAVLSAWRTQILNGFLTIAAIVAAAGTVVTILTSTPDQLPDLVIFLILTLILVALAFLRKIDIRIRTWGILAVAYVVGLATLATYGLGGSGSLYLLALPIVALILLGVRSGTLVSTISILTMTVFAFLSDRIAPLVNNQSLADRLAGSVDTLILLVVVMTLLVLFYRFQERLILQERQVQAELHDAHALLEGQNATLEQKIQERTAELLQAEEAMRKARDAAEQANQAKSAFMANMSHELAHAAQCHHRLHTHRPPQSRRLASRKTNRQPR